MATAKAMQEAMIMFLVDGGVVFCCSVTVIVPLFGA
jgi:hypothetical protein